MEIRLNLASQPYQDERRFYLQWGAALALILVLSAVLMYFAFARYRTVREASRRIHRLESDIADLQKVKENAERTLNLPQNQPTREYSQFLNNAILRKSFSWTAVLADLEKIMPEKIHVVSIQPQLDKQVQGRITVQMQLQGQTRDAGIDLVRAMEKSAHFRNAEVMQETHGQTSAGGLHFSVVADYVPGVPAGKEAKQATGDAAKKGEDESADKPEKKPETKPRHEEHKPPVKKGAA